MKPNSLKNTFCVFTEVDPIVIQELKPDFESESGSKYFYTDEGIYRLANHWGRLGNAKWRLVENGFHGSSKLKLGYARWNAFYPDNKYEHLYYLEADFRTNEVLYQHKMNTTYDGKAILRTADDTMKKVKQARNILQLTNWSKHFENHDLEDLRKLIVTDLIYTNLTLDEIKRKYA
nr:hypothetical protein [Flavobacterium amniphilum]